jgi:dihydrofolate synthase/folylpolyglutamate synthase
MSHPATQWIPDLSSDQTAQILDRLTALYPRAIDLSLERMRLLLDDLGNPQDRLPPVVHIAGTNGKGSTIAYLRAVAEAAGYRAHVYTSPHLVRFNERIRLAGALIDNALLSELLGEVEQVNAGRPITFFEVTTAAAFLAFSRVPADLVLLETGLGGRLDATNVIARPAVCGITPISFDHPDFLGDSVAQIAGEKAGILKQGVTAVIGPQSVDAASVIAARAAAVGAPLVVHGRDWRLEESRDGFRYSGRATLDLPLPGLPGRHQLDNAGLAAAIIEQLPGFAMTPAHLAEGLRRVEWPARLQRLTSGPLVDLLPEGGELFLDGGHNESGAAAIADWATKLMNGRKLNLVVAMKASKAADAFLAHLAPHAERLRSLSFPEETGWIDAERIAELARAAGIADAAASSDPATAVAALVARAGPRPRILICGSLYFAGRILSENA